jgi:hypothetical protein
LRDKVARILVWGLIGSNLPKGVTRGNRVVNLLCLGVISAGHLTKDEAGDSEPSDDEHADPLDETARIYKNHDLAFLFEHLFELEQEYDNTPTGCQVFSRHFRKSVCFLT